MASIQANSRAQEVPNDQVFCEAKRMSDSCSGGEPQADDVPEFIIRQAPERPELDKYAEYQWEVSSIDPACLSFIHCLALHR